MGPAIIELNGPIQEQELDVAEQLKWIGLAVVKKKAQYGSREHGYRGGNEAQKKM